jgi:uncharacterized YccA/Bax inhibitor family protein
MATANPAMNAAVYQRAGQAESMTAVMTLQGTVLKTAVLVAILLVAAGYTWTQFEAGAQQLAYGLLIAGAIGGLIVGMVTIFFPKASPFTAPLYAGLQGLFLGAVSAAINQQFPGIALQALGLTVGVLVIMLFLYGTGIIRATEKFKIGLVAATGAIFLVYLATMVLGFFGISIPYIHGSGPIGIGFSVVVVIIASLNLVLDFDFIEQGVARQAPRYMEWYGGFSLMVTLVWMYMEILRLLAKIRSNQS